MRLKYAGIEAAVIENIEDAFDRLGALTAAGALPSMPPCMHCELYGVAARYMLR